MEIPTQGNIRDQSLVKILVQLNRNRKTGTLSVKTPKFTKKIYVDGGDVIFASSSYEDDRLGEMLLKANKITLEQYDESVGILRASKKRQGAILVELGYISPKELFWGVKYQVREIVYSMFEMEEADYEFREEEIPAQEVITLKMSMGNLIYEGVKRIENWTRIRREMPDMSSVLRLSDDPLSLFQDIELGSQDKKVLSMIDGTKTISEIIEGSWMGSFEALKILYVLWSIGIIEEEASAFGKAGGKAAQEEEPVSVKEILEIVPGEEEAFVRKVDFLYSRLGDLSLRELLELRDDKAGPEAVKKNYYRLAKEFHPDRYFNITDKSVKEKLAAIFAALTSAYNLLRSGKQECFDSIGDAMAPVRADDSLRAEEQFRRGVEEFKKGNFWGAADNFRWASKMKPDNASYLNYLSLAYSRMPGKLKDAEEALLEAIKLEGLNADLHANLGLLYLKAGMKERAGSSFAKALQIDPGNEKARKGRARTNK